VTSAVNIAARIKQLLEFVQKPLLAPFLAEWPRTYLPRVVATSHLPVLRWLPDMLDDDAAFGTDLVNAVCTPHCRWPGAKHIPRTSSAPLFSTTTHGAKSWAGADP
jgi:hypothetical protein